MEPVRVLLVDDHSLVREGIRALLQLHADISVVGEAGDGIEAIQKVRELKPDVVVMDISMPNMSGMEATREILKDNPETKIVALSRHDNLSYVRSLLEAGALGFVPKTAVSTELAAAIRAVHAGDVFLHPTIARVITRDYVRLAGSGSGGAGIEGLTEREKEILRLTGAGYSSQQIADKLYLTVKTVLNHRRNLMDKLHIDNHAQLIKFAIRMGVVDDEA